MFSFRSADRFGMKLHALNEQGLVPQAHHLALRGARAHFETLGDRIRIDDQRMIAHRLEGIGHAREYRASIMPHRRSLAMHQAWCAIDAAAECLTHALLT